MFFHHTEKNGAVQFPDKTVKLLNEKPLKITSIDSAAFLIKLTMFFICDVNFSLN